MTSVPFGTVRGGASANPPQRPHGRCGVYRELVPPLDESTFRVIPRDKLMVRARSYSENGCGGGIALARLTCALRVTGSAYPRLAHVEGLPIATAA